MDGGCMVAGVRIPSLSDEEIARKAEELREAYAAECGPIAYPLDATDVVWSLLYARDRLSLDLESSLGRTASGALIAGKMVVLDDGGMICIDEDTVQSPRGPFTMGHELGHWILHRDCILEARRDGRLQTEKPFEMFSLQRHVGMLEPGRRRPEEWQANRFATHLLMPAPIVGSEFRKRFAEHRGHYADQCAHVARFKQRFPTLRKYSCCLAGSRENCGNRTLRNVFGISIETMAIRLEELELVCN